MSLSDLKTITMRWENTANYVIKLLLLEGVGYEVVWWKFNDGTGTRWDRKSNMYRANALAEAEAFYDRKWRNLCIAEAKIALGLLEPE